MKRTLEDRLALLEHFVFDDLVKGLAGLAKALRASDLAASSTHNLHDSEMRVLLLAALKHRPVEELVHLTARELFPILMKDLDKGASPKEGATWDALLEAGVIYSDAGLKERFTRSGNQTASGFLFADLKAGVRELDPELDPESADFRTAAILLAAAYFVGPDVDRLVHFSSYPITFVADIAQRMRTYGLWSDEGVRVDHWWNGNRITGAFWTDCLVASGVLQVGRTEDSEEFYTVLDPESKTN
jgi:hypothetical protein